VPPKSSRFVEFAGLTPTHPLIGVSKKSKCLPLVTKPRGGRNIFSRHQCLNLPEVLGDPPPPPPTPNRKDSMFNFGAKIQIYGAKIQICSAKSQIYSAKTQICSAKIQVFDPKFKYLYVCTTKNLPICMSKTPGTASLTPTHPPSVLVKH